MLQTLKNAWNTKEIRSKILFTLFILLIYRIGSVLPVPFVEAEKFTGSFSGTVLDYLNTLSGGALSAMTLFALGVQHLSHRRPGTSCSLSRNERAGAPLSCPD